MDGSLILTAARYLPDISLGGGEWATLDHDLSAWPACKLPSGVQRLAQAPRFAGVGSAVVLKSVVRADVRPAAIEAGPRRLQPFAVNLQM